MNIATKSLLLAGALTPVGNDAGLLQPVQGWT